MNSQTSITLSEHFDLEAPPLTSTRSTAQLDEFEAREMHEPKLVAVFAKSPTDRECICDFVRSAGHIPIGFALKEDLAATLRKEVCFDLFLTRFDSDGRRLSDDVQAFRHMVGTDVPLLLMAREAQLHAIAAIASAANVDFMLMPCRPSEFEARFVALRCSASPELQREGFRWGCYYFDPSARKVYMSEKEVQLLPVEFDLAYVFFRSPGVVHSRKSLFRKIWGEKWHENGSRTLDVHVAKLRKKLDFGFHRECELLAVYSVGYQLRTCYPSRDDGIENRR